MVIYALKDPNTKEIRYIGKTTKDPKKRFYAHCYPSPKTNQRHVYHWVMKLREGYQKPELLIIAHANTYEELNQLEKSCIAFARSIDLPLTNISSGGDGSVGFKRSAQTLEKMKIAQNRPHILEIKRKNAERQRIRGYLKEFGLKSRKTIYCSDGRQFSCVKDCVEQLKISQNSVFRIMKGQPGVLARKLNIRLSHSPF